VPDDFVPDDYYCAAVCLRGHTLTNRLALTELAMALGHTARRCVTCGATVIATCPECGERIRGAPENSFVDDVYKPPDFCDKCGEPFPWLSRQGLIYQLEDILDQTDVDTATKLRVREQLEALADTDIDEPQEIQRWKRIKNLAPSFIEDGRRIISILATEALKKELGL